MTSVFWCPQDFDCGRVRGRGDVCSAGMDEEDLVSDERTDSKGDVLRPAVVCKAGVNVVQLLKAWGAHVTVTCSHDAQLLVQALGADCVVDYTAGAPGELMAAAAGGKWVYTLTTCPWCHGNAELTQQEGRRRKRKEEGEERGEGRRRRGGKKQEEEG